MSNLKRRDKKGRVLRTGETQNASGLYSYRYTDKKGKRHEITSWRLTENDPHPAGKKQKKSLRELEKEIENDPYENGEYDKITVLDLARRYVKIKERDVSQQRLRTIERMINKLEQSDFGKRTINNVIYSDAVLFLQSYVENDKGHSVVSEMHGLMRCSFRLAVRDGLIGNNPFSFKTREIIDTRRDEKKPLSKEEEEVFLDFVKHDPYYNKYYDAIIVMLRTGIRISELCGLTVHDIDFNKHTMKIDHQLLSYEGTVSIGGPKTQSGNRILPIDNETEECLKRMIEYKRTMKIEPIVDGYSGFICMYKTKMSPNGRLYQRKNWGVVFQAIERKYRKTFKENPPHVSAHILRHTYCTNMIKTGISVKALQYLMGHGDASVTLETYTHFNYNDVEDELKRVGVIAEVG